MRVYCICLCTKDVVSRQHRRECQCQLMASLFSHSHSRSPPVQYAAAMAPALHSSAGRTSASPPDGPASPDDVPESPYCEEDDVPEKVCQCLQKCWERFDTTVTKRVHQYFKTLNGDRWAQYDYLASLIQMKSRKTDQHGRPMPNTKKSFRYFIPLLEEDDLMRLIEQRSGTIGMSVSPFILREAKEWDHAAVCLSAFTAIHKISEKRVTITKNTRKLQSQMKCSRPFLFKPALVVEEDTPEPKRYKSQDIYELPEHLPKRQKEKPKPPDNITFLAAEWLASQAVKLNGSSHPVNPRTYLPEGLTLPDSVTCMPLFSEGRFTSTESLPYPLEDRDRDIRIVAEFFDDQLWKPEYIE